MMLTELVKRSAHVIVDLLQMGMPPQFAILGEKGHAL